MNTLTRDYVVTSSESICETIAGGPAQWMRGVLDRCYRLALGWYAVGKQRHALAQLTEEQMQDVGLTREQALAEASKSFWQ